MNINKITSNPYVCHFFFYNSTCMRNRNNIQLGFKQKLVAVIASVIQNVREYKDMRHLIKNIWYTLSLKINIFLMFIFK